MGFETPVNATKRSSFFWTINKAYFDALFSPVIGALQTTYVSAVSGALFSTVRKAFYAAYVAAIK